MRFENEDLLSDLKCAEHMSGIMTMQIGEPVLFLAKIYIHPDSEHLLEPRVGDVFVDTATKAGRVVSDTWEKENNWKGGALTYYGMLDLKDATKRARGGYLKIIQREGKAFHWPEVEEV